MGARLKLLRKKNGWTLEALAQQTGLTKSYLSKIERGLSVPSIAAALKLAHALRIGVEQLFSEGGAETRMAVVRAAERTPIATTGSAASSVYEGIATELAHKRLLPFIVYPAMDFADSVFKEHDGEELMFVHRGKVEIAFPDRSVQLEAGDSLYFDAQTPHRLRSLGSKPAQVLVVVYDPETAEAAVR